MLDYYLLHMKALFVLVLSLLVFASNCTLGLIAGLAAAKIGILKGALGGGFKGGNSGHGGKKSGGSSYSSKGSKKSGYGGKKSGHGGKNYGHGSLIIGGGCNCCNC